MCSSTASIFIKINDFVLFFLLLSFHVYLNHYSWKCLWTTDGVIKIKLKRLNSKRQARFSVDSENKNITDSQTRFLESCPVVTWELQAVQTRWQLKWLLLMTDFSLACVLIKNNLGSSSGTGQNCCNGCRDVESYSRTRTHRCYGSVATNFWWFPDNAFWDM